VVRKRNQTLRGLLAVVFTGLLVGFAPAVAQEPGEPALGHLPDPSMVTPKAEKGPGIEVVLSVYSGRKNPRWVLEEGEDFDRVLVLLRDLKPESGELFDYDQWNRLGYPSFLLRTHGLEEVPYGVHVWRDMAVVIPNRDGKSLQAMGAEELYDTLVAQAKKRDFGEFFNNDKTDRKGDGP
jgi:hypothetical protein